MSEFEAARGVTTRPPRPGGGGQIPDRPHIPEYALSITRDIWLEKMNEYVVNWCGPEGIPKHIDARKIWRLLSRSDRDSLRGGRGYPNGHPAWADFKRMQREFIRWMDGKTHWQEGGGSKVIPDFGGPEAIIAMIILGGDNGQYPACWEREWADMKLGHVIKEIGSCPVDPFWEGAKFESPIWRESHCKKDRMSRLLSITPLLKLPNHFRSQPKMWALKGINNWVRPGGFLDRFGPDDEVFNADTHRRPRPTNLPVFSGLARPAAFNLPASSAPPRRTTLDSPVSSGPASRKRQHPVNQSNENDRPASPRRTGQTGRRPGSHSAPRISAPANLPGQRAAAGSPTLTARRSPTVASITSLALTARRTPAVTPARPAPPPPPPPTSPLATQTQPVRRSSSPPSRLPQPQRFARVDERERRPAPNARSVTAPLIDRKPIRTDLDSDVEEVKPSLEVLRRAHKASEEKVIRQYLKHLNEYKTSQVVDLVGYLNGLPPSFWEQKITAAVVKKCEAEGPKRCKYKWRTHLRMIQEMFQDLEYLDDNNRLTKGSVPKINTDLVWDEDEA